jgi:hypothetical protein
MPVHAILEPDTTFAGGVVYAGNTWQVRHNQLSGNTEGKRRKMIEALQDTAFDNVMDVDDLPTDDQEWPDHPDNGQLGYNTYDDQFRRPDDSLIDERAFYFQRTQNQLFLIHRSVVCDIVLEQENDPTLGGNDRYSLELRRTNG